jgi:probable phosphoglycerate mutase
MNTTHFWLVRHGETLWNAERRLQGWLDIPLNANGKKQAEELAQYLESTTFDANFDAFYSSDLSRAYDTARIATRTLTDTVVQHPGLRERSYGVYQGITWAALSASSESETPTDLRDPDRLIEDGESYRAFAQRVQTSFEEIARAHPGGNIMVFTHGGVIDIAWRCSTGTALEAPRPFPILNVSINRCGIHGPGEWFLQDWGYTGHLRAEAFDDVI